jgi:hypothetical protein
MIIFEIFDFTKKVSLFIKRYSSTKTNEKKGFDYFYIENFL